ncbi:hypothetical protein HY409_03120 [Candidatus Gottesmanbacteria bacterium]|nr:hypothetical protein [Candidatus Gottesmanbacteria bacterium]
MKMNARDLITIIFQVRMYVDFVEKAALQDFLKLYEVERLSKLADSEFKEYVKGRIKVNGYKSSVKNRRWNKKMYNLLRSYIALSKKPKDNLGEDMRTAKQQIEESCMENYRIYRREQANKIEREYNLSDNLITLVYEEILRLVSGKETVTIDELEDIKMIETEGIQKSLRELCSDLDFKILTLSQLRRSTTGIVNTACYHCGKTLIRKDESNYCRKRENRKCYEDRISLEKQERKEVEFILSKRRCINCDREASFNHIYKGKQYCSRRCYETYRKRLWRRQTVHPLYQAK